MTASPTSTTGRDIELEIGGMTCASCANRIERKLNKLDGVSATVNYATEKAQVHAPEDTDPDTLIDEVAKAGYTATLPAVDEPTDDGDDRPLLAPLAVGNGSLSTSAKASAKAITSE